MASIIANKTYTWTLIMDHQNTCYMYLIPLHHDNKPAFNRMYCLIMSKGKLIKLCGGNSKMHERLEKNKQNTPHRRSPTG